MNSFVFETMERRQLLAVTAAFIPATGVLTITGDALPNTIDIGPDAGGIMLVNGGAVAIAGGTPTVATTKSIIVFGGDGDDRIIWEAGASSGQIDGGSGTDTVQIEGGNNAEVFSADMFGAQLLFSELDPAALDLDITTIENLQLNTNGGDDTFFGGSGFAGVIACAVDGGAGNDSIIGTDGADRLSGGDGDDFIQSRAGNDAVFLGAGDDFFRWDPADGSDAVDGGDGTDLTIVNGSNQDESFDFSANGSRLSVARDGSGAVLDGGAVENVNVHALSGADTITVNDLTQTSVLQLTLDLSAGGDFGGQPGIGDGANDTVVVNGTGGDDFVQVVPDADLNSLSVIGLVPTVSVKAAEGKDLLNVNAGDGNDTVSAIFLPGSLIGFSLNGGAGDDCLIGGHGDDTVLGGDGSDTVTAQSGSDLVELGAGDDRFDWFAPDGSDVVDGQAGIDTLVFNGSDNPENIDISANGSRVRVMRDVGNVAMDLGSTELLTVRTNGGADNVVVNDLTGTSLTNIKVTQNFDVQPDNVTVNGTNGADAIVLDGDFINGVTVFGLTAQVRVAGGLSPAKGLTVNGNGGADTIDASTVAADAINLGLNGGDGNDVITGSGDVESIDGGAQTDTINVPNIGSGGITTVLGSSGDDAVNVTGNVAFDQTQRIGALSIGSGGVARLTAGGAKVLSATSLNLTGSGKLDLSDNDLIVDYSPPQASPIASIRSMLASGRNGGAWNGAGIITSSGNASNLALGFGEAASLFPAGIFSGQRVDATAVVMKFTFYGDANLDGQVDVADLGRLATDWQTFGRNWSDGDFSYDSAVDVTDLGLLASNWQAGVNSPLSRQSSNSLTSLPSLPNRSFRVRRIALELS